MHPKSPPWYQRYYHRLLRYIIVKCAKWNNNNTKRKNRIQFWTKCSITIVARTDTQFSVDFFACNATTNSLTKNNRKSEKRDTKNLYQKKMLKIQWKTCVTFYERAITLYYLRREWERERENEPCTVYIVHILYIHPPPSTSFTLHSLLTAKHLLAHYFWLHSLAKNSL